jgi:cytochrome c-type biogenesis protein CcmH
VITFWLLAAGLIGLALLFVVPPLVLRRAERPDVDRDALNLAVFRQQIEELDSDLGSGDLDQEQYDAARLDLERELLRDVEGSDEGSSAAGTNSGRWAALALAVLIPVISISLYLHQGDVGIIPRLETAAVQPAGSQQIPADHPAAGGPPASLDVMVERLAERMEKQPDDVQGWLILGRSYTVLHKPDQAVHALEKAYQLAPKQPDVLTAYAEALATKNGNHLDGRPAELIKTALEIDPQNINARWLDGLLAFQQGQFPRAASQWEGILARLDPQAKEAGVLHRLINEARRRGGLPHLQTPAGGSTQMAENAAAGAPAGTGAQTSQAAKLTVDVSLDPALAAKATPQETVFIYAKAVSGPPMPLAVQRVHVSQLPLSVTLDDSMAMMPAMRLSAFPEVTVGARISKSGQPIPQSGDLEGMVSPVRPGQSAPVKVVINQVHP